MKNLSFTLLLFFLCACQTNSQAIANDNIAIQAKSTSPAVMQVDLSVQGHTSTLHNMNITFLGQTIPYTYSDGKISNSRGYDWWVSKHFALKSDLPKEKVTLYLELLEMAYPHYVSLFGMEPPNIERQRIAVVYGSSRERVREAMLDDGFLRGVHDTAGGETMFYNRAGYNFPSHREHHQRYIVIHETMHAFHMALNGHSTWAPNWITEGLADSVAHHVYDPKQKQLTVMVFDRAPMNYIETGLKQYYSANKPTIEQINDDPTLKRGLNFFIIHYLLSSPERAQYFAYFVQQLRLANPHSEATLSTANSLLKNTFKDWLSIEQGFADFVQNIRPSFHLVSGPWEQNGNAYWLRNIHSTELSRLDINPANKAEVSHPIIDFPVPMPNPLITLSANNELAALIEFETAQLHRGAIGLALQGKISAENQHYRRTFIGKEQANNDQLLTLLVVDGERLALSASNTKGFNNQQIAFTPELKQAIASNAMLAIKLSLNATQQQLTVMLSAGTTNEPVIQSFTATLPHALFTELNTRKISLLSKNINHKITPYLFANKTNTLSSDQLNKITNPWLFKGYAKLNRLFITCQTYSVQLKNCQRELAILIKQLNQPQRHSAIRAALPALVKQYQTTLGDTGFSPLSGITSGVYYHQGNPFLRVENPSDLNLTLAANVDFNDNNGELLNSQQLKQVLTPGIHNIALENVNNTNTLMIKQTLNWGELSQNSQLNALAIPFDGVQMQLTQLADVHENWQFDLSLSGPYSGETTGELHLKTLNYHSLTTPKALIKKVNIVPYQQQNYHFSVPISNDKTLVEVTALLNVDGEEIRLVKQLSL